jgi:hypothetical protein
MSLARTDRQEHHDTTYRAMSDRPLTSRRSAHGPWQRSCVVICAMCEQKRLNRLGAAVNCKLAKLQARQN